MAVEHKYVRKDYNLSYILYNQWKETPDPVFCRLVQLYAMKRVVLAWHLCSRIVRLISHSYISDSTPEVLNKSLYYTYKQREG